MTKTTKDRRRIIWWGLVLSPVLGLFLMLVLASFSNLPSTEDLENPRSDLATAGLFSDGSLMGQYYRENRIPVEYEKISPNVVNALIATEDERFRESSAQPAKSQPESDSNFVAPASPNCSSCRSRSSMPVPSAG